MFTETTSLGLDVHARSVVAAAIDGSTGEVIRKKLTNDLVEIGGFVEDLARDHGPLRITYEAGPTGFGLARTLLEAGYFVQVAAPSKLIRPPPGDRVKTDRNDAMLLARLDRAGDIVAVRIPTRSEESARDLVRSRDDARRDLMTSRHRLGKLLLRHGYAFPGKTAWGPRHDAWMRGIRRDELTAHGTGTLAAFDDAYDTVHRGLARRDRLDAVILELAEDSEFTEVTQRLSCLRGISTLTAFGLAVEIGDGNRFTGKNIAAFLGLPPPSTPPASPGRWVGSPARATLTPAGCWWSPPGSTRRSTGPGRPCGRTGRKFPRLSPSQPTWATGTCTGDG